jgi:AmmeMemoRadiSam system protein B
MHPAVRAPAVAGTFYPGNPAELAADLESLLADALAEAGRGQPKAIIAPHAGYIYSGSTAADAYARLAPWRDAIRRVVLLGPTHRVPVRGLALSSAEFFATPLGKVRLDREAPAALADLPQVTVSDPAHAWEHSLEVHLPFLQTVLGDFSLVPLAVGQANADEVAQVLDRLWGGPETLFVISSDLSHYLPYTTASRTDQATCERILQLDPHIALEQACGAYPVNGLLLAARRHGLKPEMIHLCNSGDTAGGTDRVVGYAAFAFYAREGQDA